MSYGLYGICAKTLCTPNCYVMTIFRPKDCVLLENGADCSCFFFFIYCLSNLLIYILLPKPLNTFPFLHALPIFCHFDDIFQHWKGILWLKILSKVFCAKLYPLENTIIVVFSFIVVVLVKVLLPFVMFW